MRGMNVNNSGIKKVILFYHMIVNPGGEEKLLFEQATYFNKIDVETYITTFEYNGVYSDAYSLNTNVIDINSNLLKAIIHKIPLSLERNFCKILALRRKIKRINPDLVISHDYLDTMYLYFATLFTRVPYVVHIPETMFRNDKSMEKYALIHRKVFNEIRESTIGGMEFITLKPKGTLKRRIIEKIIAEFRAMIIYYGVRKAKKIFVLSNQMKWEVNKLYSKDAIVLKGAFSSAIFDYKPRENIKERLGLTDKKMILNVNRLDSRKRVDLLIKAFKQICDEFDDVVLVIGGVGPEEEKLKNLTKELNIEDRVKFMGYIREEERKDYYACCDVFIHPNWADFAIAPYEALALQKKVVWSSEMEIDEHLATNKHIFVADPTVVDFTEAIKKALTTKVAEKNDLSEYTWGVYFSKIYRICEELEDDGKLRVVKV